MDVTQYPKKMKIRWRWDGENGDYITYQNPSTGAISILNPVAAQIFAKCDGNRDINTIIDEIFQEFAAPSREQVEQDVFHFLTFLSRMGAVKLLKD